MAVKDNTLNNVKTWGSTVKEIMVTYILPVVLATNAFNLLWNRGVENEEKIVYNDGAQKKRINHAVKILKLETEIQRQKDLREQDKIISDLKEHFTKIISDFKLEEKQEDIQEEKDKK